LPGWITQPSWSPDGRWLTFAGGPSDAPTRLYAVRADGKHLVWREGRNSARWGPDLSLKPAALR
jgi:Tol biopolymer transport system component